MLRLGKVCAEHEFQLKQVVVFSKGNLQSTIVSGGAFKASRHFAALQYALTDDHLTVNFCQVQFDFRDRDSSCLQLALYNNIFQVSQFRG